MCGFAHARESIVLRSPGVHALEPGCVARQLNVSGAYGGATASSARIVGGRPGHWALSASPALQTLVEHARWIVIGTGGRADCGEQNAGGG